MRVQIMGDSKVACSWLNGQLKFAPRNRICKHVFSAFQQMLFDAWIQFDFVARTQCFHFASVLHRDFNLVADKYASSGVDSFGTIDVGRFDLRARRPKYLRVWFDGGYHDKRMGAGVWIEAATKLKAKSQLPDWEFVCGFGTRLKTDCLERKGNSMIAETCAGGLALCLLFEVLNGPFIEWSPYMGPRPRCAHSLLCWKACESLLD